MTAPRSLQRAAIRARFGLHGLRDWQERQREIRRAESYRRQQANQSTKRGPRS